jgi:hypothetical protein
MTDFKVVQAVVTYLVYGAATDEEAMQIATDAIIDSHLEQSLEVELISTNVVSQDAKDEYTY